MSELDELVSKRVAYFAMFEYLKRYFERGASDEVGGMLGGLSLLPDGGSADPAALEDFSSCIEAVMTAESKGGYADCSMRIDNG